MTELSNCITAHSISILNSNAAATIEWTAIVNDLSPLLLTIYKDS